MESNVRNIPAIFLLIAVLLGTANATVIVETRDEQISNPSHTLLRLRAFNGTGDTLRDVEFRYFLAPDADLILGQSSKELYGRFLGRAVTVHQYAMVYHVAFEPETETAVAGRGR